MSIGDSFDLVEAGEGHWSVHNAGTTQVAGLLQQDADGYLLTDAQDKDLGRFATIDEALTRLYGED